MWLSSAQDLPAKREIGALHFQRSGLSKDQQQLAELTRASAESASPALSIRDPYIFEFVAVKAKEVMAERTREGAIQRSCDASLGQGEERLWLGQGRLGHR